jgi:hypothetical protein
MTKAELHVWNRESAIPETIIHKRGWPDFLIERDGEVWAIEVKRPADRVSDAQSAVHAALNRAGIPVTVEVVPGIGGFCRDGTDAVTNAMSTSAVLAEMRQMETRYAELKAYLQMLVPHA